MKSIVQKIKNIHDHDINCLSTSENMILSGGEEGRVNVIDDRTLKPIVSWETEKAVRSIGFSPKGDYFAVGNDKLSFYKTD